MHPVLLKILLWPSLFLYPMTDMALLRRAEATGYPLIERLPARRTEG